MYSPNPQRHHLVLFHREKRQYNISKSAFFFSHVTCSVCPICRAVGRERKDILYNIVYSCFFLPRPVDDVGRKSDERQEEYTR